ncbi:uncharacterized protein BROUX77_004690 [Berkeleyomyces rouxiae]|uniref:uncharacterized protein n=1 Tax=Berkeleyomyces rouxiae TaxID=2035830 RepID=UPI003B82516F
MDPIAFSQRLLFLAEQLSAVGIEKPKAELICLVASAGQRVSPAWYSASRATLDKLKIYAWTKPITIVQIMDNLVTQPVVPSEEFPQALATSPEKKKKKKKCSRHLRGNHDVESCRVNLCNQTQSKPSDSGKSKIIDLGNSVVLFTSMVANTVEGNPSHPDLCFVDSGASFHMTGARDTPMTPYTLITIASFTSSPLLSESQTTKELLDTTTNAARMALGANEGAAQAAQAAIEVHRRAYDSANEANSSADAANHLENVASYSANAASHSASEAHHSVSKANEAVVAAISVANCPPLYNLVEDDVESISSEAIDPRLKQIEYEPEDLWIFKTKYADGKAIRYKTRWVACGNFQDPTEYETFSAVASATSLRSVLALAAINQWRVFQADVNTAFLHGKLLPEEHIYIRMPDGYRSKNSSGQELVGKLCRALYGLRHALRCWFEALEKLLLSLDFHSLDVDPCIFLTPGCIIMIHVDDMLVIGPDPVRLRHVYEQIHAVYPMKGLDPVSTYLSIQFSVEPGQISLVQTQYVADLMDRFQVSHLPAKVRAVPMSGTTFRNISSPAPNSPALNTEDTALYLQIVGSLQWLSCMTRPDITFATSHLARYSHRTTTAHLEAAKGVLRYLRSTLTRGICYSASANQGLEVYTDAAFGDHLDRKSTSGYLFKLAGSPISWRAVKQSIQAGSTADAEYLAATIAAKEARYIRRLLADLPQSRNESDLQRPLTLFCDSTNAIANMSRPSINKRTLHLDSAYHFIHEAVQSGWIKPTHVSTENMAADGLTKTLDSQKYAVFLRLLGLVDQAHNSEIKRAC